MPFQPLSKSQLKADKTFNETAVDNRPDHVLRAAKIIEIGGEIESLESTIMAGTLGAANARPVTAMLAAIQTSGVRHMALRAAAETTLEAEDINLLTAVLKVCRNGPIADRNALVHSIWGFFDDIPDGLLLWDASTRAQSHIDDLNHFAKENNKGTLIPRPDTRDIRIATLEELQKGIERARQSESDQRFPLDTELA